MNRQESLGDLARLSSEFTDWQDQYLNPVICECQDPAQCTACRCRLIESLISDLFERATKKENWKDGKLT